MKPPTRWPSTTPVTASVPGVKSETSWTSLAVKRPPSVKKPLQGHVLAEGHELDLVVSRDELPRRVEQLRPDVDAALLRGERLEVVVAEEEVDPPPPHRLPQEPGQSGLLVEEEGHGGLRPHDEPGARVGGLLGELQVPPDVRRGVLGHPLVLLPDAPLHEPDRDAPRLRDRLLHLPAAPAPGPAHQERHRGERRAPRRHARRHRRARQQCRDRADEERDPVDRRDRGDLGEGQEIVLAVAEERPGEREEGVGAGVLEPGPQRPGRRGVRPARTSPRGAPSPTRTGHGRRRTRGRARP